MSENQFVETAKRFVQTIVSGDFTKAHGMLSQSLCSETSPEALQESYTAMLAYGSGAAGLDGYVHTMTDWPNKRAEDVGWVYVSISGEDFLEAVTMVVSKESDELKISSIEWGRP